MHIFLKKISTTIMLIKTHDIDVKYIYFLQDGFDASSIHRKIRLICCAGLPSFHDTPLT